MAVVSPAARAKVLQAICDDGPITVSGDSMEPTLHTGDRIAVRVDPSPSVGDVIVFVDGESQTVVHRLVAHFGSTYVCLGDNRRALDPLIEAACIVGVAQAIISGDEQISITATTGLARASQLRRALLGVIYGFGLWLRRRKTPTASKTESEVRDVAT